jgi:hypothetical protein
MQLIRCALIYALAACGGSTPAPQHPTVDTASLAAEIDAEQANLAMILHRDREDCAALATNLRTLFARMTATFTHAKDVTKDPTVARQLTTDMKRYDAAAAQRAAAIDADVAGPCVRDATVRDVLMTMPTL